MMAPVQALLAFAAAMMTFGRAACCPASVAPERRQKEELIEYQQMVPLYFANP